MTSHPDLLILGYSEAAMFLRGARAAEVSALIAIHGQREFAAECSASIPKLVLRFDDTATPDTTNPIEVARFRVRQREAAEIGLRLTPPTIEYARAIVSFASSIQRLEGALLCHCLAGISRSPAAALLCLAAWSGPGRERECFDRVQRARPAAIPHPDLVRFGDEVLGREGRLISAIQDR